MAPTMVSMFSGFLLQQGFTNSKVDASLFTRHNDQGKMKSKIFILVYVDDILITGSSEPSITKLIVVLSSKFAMKDLGSLSYFLGIEVIPHDQGYILSQAKYASDLLIKSGMLECKPSASPSSVKPPVVDHKSKFADVHWYRTVVGSLQYLTLTMPEISYVVNVACQHMHAPTQSHIVAVKRILRYIKGSLHEGLQFIPGSLTLTAFSDSDWAGDNIDRRSTTRYCVFLGSNLISWCAKKQHTVARSST